MATQVRIVLCTLAVAAVGPMTTLRGTAAGIVRVIDDAESPRRFRSGQSTDDAKVGRNAVVFDVPAGKTLFYHVSLDFVDHLVALSGAFRPVPLPPHPRLMVDAARVEAIKKRIEAHDWAKARWAVEKKAADKALEKEIVLPPRGGTSAHYFANPKTGGA